MAYGNNYSYGSSNYTGDCLRIDRKENKFQLTVTGDANVINILKNEGTIDICGDACNITVESGNGFIRLIGDAGTIYIGPSVIRENITILGDHNRIVDIDRGKERSRETKPLQWSNLNDKLKNNNESVCVKNNNESVSTIRQKPSAPPMPPNDSASTSVQRSVTADSTQHISLYTPD